MLNDQIVGLSCTEGILNVVQPFVRKRRIYRIHNGNFIVNNRVGIIRHTIRHNVLSFKQIHLVIVHANVLDVFGNRHGVLPHSH